MPTPQETQQLMKQVDNTVYAVEQYVKALTVDNTFDGIKLGSVWRMFVKAREKLHDDLVAMSLMPDVDPLAPTRTLKQP